MSQFTLEELNLGITRGINAFTDPFAPEITDDAVNAIITNGQVTSQGFIIVEDPAFTNPQNVGPSGVFLDPIGDIKVLGLPPGTTEGDIKGVVSAEFARVEAAGTGAVIDLNDITNAFLEFRSGNARPLEVIDAQPSVETGDAVQIDAARIEAVLDSTVRLNVQDALSNDDKERAVELADEFGVQTNNGYVVVQTDFIFANLTNGSTIESGFLVDPNQKVLFIGTGDEGFFGRDNALVPQILPGATTPEGQPIFTQDQVNEFQTALSELDAGLVTGIDVVG